MNWVKNGTLLIVSILICAVLLEAGARLFGLGYSFSPFEGDRVVHHKHPQNYAFMGYHPNGMWDDIPVQYDQYGNRYDGENTIEAPDGVALGDSFVEATMTLYPATIPAAFTNVGYKVWNFGVAGYSPILSYLQLKGSKERLRKVKFVFHLLYMNDVEADRVFEEMAEFADGEVVGVPGHRGWMADILRNSHFLRAIRRIQLSLEFRFGVMNDNWRLNPVVPAPVNETNAKYLLKTHELAKSLGARYFLACVPPKEQGAYAATEEGVFCQSVREFTAQSGIDYIDLPRAFSGQPLFFADDIHFGPTGAKRTSDHIANTVAQALASD